MLNIPLGPGASALLLLISLMPSSLITMAMPLLRPHGTLVLVSLRTLFRICWTLSKPVESLVFGGGHAFLLSVPASYELCDGVGRQGYKDLMKPLLGTGTYAELMDGTKVKYDGGVFMMDEN